MSHPISTRPRIRALILDRQHRCLLIKQGDRTDGDWSLPSVDLDPSAVASAHPLRVIAAALKASVGLVLPQPAGSYVPPDGASPRDFTFVLQDAADVPSGQWLPLSRAQEILAASGKAETLWRIYTKALLGGYEMPRRDFDVFCFGSQPEQAARIGHLVIKGTKRATTGLVASSDKTGATIPWPGLLSVVTDYYGYPLCVIETLTVQRLPFREVSPEIAAAAGEGDLSYDDWRDGYVDCFKREAAALGLTFDEDSLVFNERFRVVKILGPGSSLLQRPGAPESIRFWSCRPSVRSSACSLAPSALHTACTSLTQLVRSICNKEGLRPHRALHGRQRFAHVVNLPIG